MKPTIRRWLALAIAFLGLYLALPEGGLAQNDQGQNDQWDHGIKLGVPNGTYSVHITGENADMPDGEGLRPAIAGAMAPREFNAFPSNT